MSNKTTASILREWMDALQNQTFVLVENKVEYIANNMNNALVSRYKQDTGNVLTASEVVNALANADPTKKQTFLQWIANMYVKGQFKIEDVTRVKDDLTTFERVKAKLESKDINSYKTLPELYAVLKPFENSDAPLTNKAAERQLREEMYKQAKVIHKGSDFILLSPQTKEAAQYFGRGTKWCTSATNDNKFQSYVSKGPLYILIDSQGNKYQFWINTHYESDYEQARILDRADRIPSDDDNDSDYDDDEDDSDFEYEGDPEFTLMDAQDQDYDPETLVNAHPGLDKILIKLGFDPEFWNGVDEERLARLQSLSLDTYDFGDE